MDGSQPRHDLATQRVSKGVREFLERVGQERSLGAGEILFHAGQDGRSLFLVRRGSLSVYRALEEERKEILGWIQEGEILGVVEFLEGGTRSFTAEATVDSAVVEFGREALEGLERENPAMSFELVNAVAITLSQRLRLTNDLHKREILRGIGSSGALLLDLHYILRDTFQVEVCLVGGERFAGSIVLMTRSFGGFQITIVDSEGHLTCIPYESVASIQAKE